MNETEIQAVTRHLYQNLLENLENLQLPLRHIESLLQLSLPEQQETNRLLNRILAAMLPLDTVAGLDTEKSTTTDRLQAVEEPTTVPTNPYLQRLTERLPMDYLAEQRLERVMKQYDCQHQWERSSTRPFDKTLAVCTLCDALHYGELMYVLAV